MPDVVFGTKTHTLTLSQPGGVLVYMRTAEGNDALAWVNEHGHSVTESQFAVLKAAACTPDTLHCRVGAIITSWSPPGSA